MATFWQYWEDSVRITGRDGDAETKRIPALLPIIEIPLDTLYHCRRGLLWKILRRIKDSDYVWLRCGRKIPEGKRKVIFTLEQDTKAKEKVEL